MGIRQLPGNLNLDADGKTVQEGAASSLPSKLKPPGIIAGCREITPFEKEDTIERRITPISMHLGMEEILIDAGQFPVKHVQ